MDRRTRVYYLLVGMQFGIALGSAISYLVYAALSFFENRVENILRWSIPCV